MKKTASKPWQRLLFYIVLNVIISACTTLTILWVWNRSRETPDLASANQALATLLPAAQTPVPSPTGSPDTQGELPVLIQIDNVFGVGNLADEVVLLKRSGEGDLVLTGWKLQDGSGNAFTFPTLILFKDGAIQVHTAAGVNTVADLFWGRDSATWKNGDTVTLLDEQGRLRATYRIP